MFEFTKVRFVLLACLLFLGAMLIPIQSAKSTVVDANVIMNPPAAAHPVMPANAHARIQKVGVILEDGEEIEVEGPFVVDLMTGVSTPPMTFALPSWRAFSTSAPTR